jgi:hypothetical protein
LRYDAAILETPERKARARRSRRRSGFKVRMSQEPDLVREGGEDFSVGGWEKRDLTMESKVARRIVRAAAAVVMSSG